MSPRCSTRAGGRSAQPQMVMSSKRPQITDGAGMVADRDRAPDPATLPWQGGRRRRRGTPRGGAAAATAQRGDAGMVSAEPAAEQGQAGGTGLHRLGPNSGRHGAQVANERVPDDRLRRRSHPLLDRRVAGVAVLRRTVDDAELVADGVQTVQQPALGGTAAWQHRDRGVDVGADDGQVVDQPFQVCRPSLTPSPTPDRPTRSPSPSPARSGRPDQPGRDASGPR